jgi:hypothetical protein
MFERRPFGTAIHQKFEAPDAQPIIAEAAARLVQLRGWMRMSWWR